MNKPMREISPRARIKYWLFVLKPGDRMVFDLLEMGIARKTAVNSVHQLNAVQMLDGVKTHYRTIRCGANLLGVQRER